MLPTAIEELKLAEKVEPKNPSVHRFLATAYGRVGQEPVAKVELAEEAILDGRPRAGRRPRRPSGRTPRARGPDGTAAG